MLSIHSLMLTLLIFSIVFAWQPKVSKIRDTTKVDGGFMKRCQVANHKLITALGGKPIGRFDSDHMYNFCLKQSDLCLNQWVQCDNKYKQMDSSSTEEQFKTYISGGYK